MASLNLADLHDRAYAEGLEMELELSISDWADEFRILTSKTGAEVGPWRTERTPYLREIMDALGPSHPAQRIVFDKGSQVGGTECLNNWLGYIIHRTPAPVLMVYPTVDTARRISKQRLAAMIEATPVLRERVREARSRDAGNTTFSKEFQGGILMLTGANSGAGLRSMPVRFLLCDEVDEYPGDVDNQGDPLALAEKRTTNFPNRKEMIVGTPTLHGLSRIAREYALSDQRRYFVRCPHCGRPDWIQWRLGGWRGDEGNHHHIHFEDRNPATACLRCVQCGKLTPEHMKTALLAGGEWRPTAVGDGRTIGFHLSALYSPLGWQSWAACVDEFLKVKDDPFRLKAWVNTTLGETWEEKGESVAPGSLLARVEQYASEVPTGVGILVASVDVQADRLECAVKGYGDGEESWLIALAQFHGDPGQEEVWLELDRFLLGTFTHDSGREVKIDCVTVDSGHHTDQVYKFCRARLARRVFPVKGGGERGREVVARPSIHNRYRVKLFTLCVDTAKDIIYSRMRIEAPGPGFMHLPAGTADEEYVAQLTAERAIRKYVKGRGSVRQWVKIRDRNEALDLEVYALAALYVLGMPLVRSLKKRAEDLARLPDPVLPLDDQRPAGSAPPAGGRRRRRGWVGGWNE
jgi:phage terminase large subunit GpA-like protein